MQSIRTCLIGLASIAAVVAAAAVPTIPSPGKPLSLGSTDPSLVGKAFTVNDQVVGQGGMRFVCGQVDNTGFIAKFDRRGVFQWHQTVSFGAGDSVVALIAHGTSLYALSSTPTFSHIVNLDQTSGSTTWTENSPFLGGANDFAMLPFGGFVSVGDYQSLYLMATWWPSNGSDPSGGDGTPIGLLGRLAAVSVAPNGVVYAGGSGNVTGVANPIFVAFDPARRVNAYYSPLEGDLSRVKYDVTGNDAVFSGYVLSGADSYGIVATMTDDVNPDDFSLANILLQQYTLSVENQDAVSDLEVDDFGHIVLVGSAGYSGGTRVGYAFGFHYDAGLNTDWGSYIPTFGSGNQALGALIENGQVHVLSKDFTPISSSSGVYAPYTISTFGIDGQPLNFRALRDMTHAADSGFTWNGIPKDSMTFGNGMLNIYARTLDGGTGFWPASPVSGPDDTYQTPKNVDLTTTLFKGSVLDNDADGFYVDESAALVPGSVQGLASVDMNPDGTFTAHVIPGYAGQAGFSYAVRSGFSTVATHHVKVHVQNDGVLPVAVDDAQTVAAGSGPNTILVLSNDYDPGTGTLFIMSKTNGAHGQVKVAADGQSLTYRPFNGYTGTDTFTYKIKNLAGDVATATVTVTVE